MSVSKKELKKIMKAIELMGVKVIDVNVNDHIKLRVQNPKTETVRLVVVSKSPKSKGTYHEIKSSVRKVFRKAGEVL
tara:strand:+ start:1423 stop:1653 length:231 start_codon:yes stop_codon:yes gene_type:complete